MINIRTKLKGNRPPAGGLGRQRWLWREVPLRDRVRTVRGKAAAAATQVRAKLCVQFLKFSARYKCYVPSFQNFQL